MRNLGRNGIANIDKSRYTLHRFSLLLLLWRNFFYWKVKESRNRPGVAQRVTGGLGSQIFMTFNTLRWWSCQPHAPAAFTPQETFLVLIFSRGWVDPRAMVRSAETCLWKIQWHHRESIPGPSDQQRSALTTTPPHAPIFVTKVLFFGL